MDSVIMEIGSSLLRAVPNIIAWIVGVVLAVIMIKRGGLKAEKLLLIGCCLMLIEIVLRPVALQLLMNWVRGRDTSYIGVGQTVLYTQIPFVIISLSAFVCLVWAFWIKFRVKKQEMV